MNTSKINYFTSEPMKYFAPPSSMSKSAKRFKIEQMIDSGKYLFSIKRDGNWSRAVITKDKAALQTRGISVKTKTYGEIQDKVLFWNDVLKAYQNEGDTVLLGEVYFEGGIDATTGSILRCLPDKALARQKDKPLEWYIFDVLCYKGKHLMETPLQERISLIPQIVKEINSPLVHGATYYEMDNTFFDKLADIFARGLEGVVCYKKTALYEPGKRGPHAYDSLKVKQEISNDVDCFIIGTEPPTLEYTGKDIGSWQYWKNMRTGEKLFGVYFSEYQLGEPYIPISKNYYYNWPGAIYVGVYKPSDEIYQLCKVAGLTEEMKTQLRDHFDDWYLCPLTIGGMMVSDTGDGAISIRHPYIKSIRREDIDPKDCTLEKILN